MTQDLWTLKVIRGSDVRRYHCEGDPMCTTLEQLRAAAGYLFGLVENEKETLIFMYMDEEGYLCTLCDATLRDVLSRFDGSFAFRIFIATATPHVAPHQPWKYFLPPNRTGALPRSPHWQP